MHLEVSENKDSDLQSPEYIKYIYIVGGVILAFIIIVILIKVSRRRKSFEE